MINTPLIIDKSSISGIIKAQKNPDVFSLRKGFIDSILHKKMKFAAVFVVAFLALSANAKPAEDKSAAEDKSRHLLRMVSVQTSNELFSGKILQA